jgi:hypothetical protein
LKEAAVAATSSADASGKDETVTEVTSEIAIEGI